MAYPDKDIPEEGHTAAPGIAGTGAPAAADATKTRLVRRKARIWLGVRYGVNEDSTRCNRNCKRR